jgi:hypothetical protein
MAMPIYEVGISYSGRTYAEGKKVALMFAILPVLSQTTLSLSTKSWDLHHLSTVEGVKNRDGFKMCV